MDDFNNSKTPCGAKGFDMSGFYRLKKRKLVIGGGLMISWSWNHFFFSLLERKSAFIFEDGSESPPYPSIKTRAGFFLKRFNHYFSCLCGTSGFLAFVGGKWTQLSPQFTVWLWVDFWSFSCTSVTSRLYSGFVFVLILMRFILQLMALFLNHDFDILMHYFVLSLKKKINISFCHISTWTILKPFLL